MDRVNAVIAFEEPRFVKFSPVLVPLPGVQRNHSHTAFKGVNANPPTRDTDHSTGLQWQDNSIESGWYRLGPSTCHITSPELR